MARLSAATEPCFGDWARDCEARFLECLGINLTGTLEVVGAFGMFLPRAVFFAALLLCAIMMGAIVAHLAILGGNPTPAIVLLILAGTIAYLRRP